MRILSISVGVLLLLSFTVNTLLERLGLDAEATNKMILYNIVQRHSAEPVSESDLLKENRAAVKHADYNAFKVPRTKMLPTIIAGDTKGTAKEVMQYIKDYVNSAEFKDAYVKLRMKTKPTSEPTAMSDEALTSMRKSLAEQEKQYAELKKNSYITSDMLDKMKAGIEETRNTIERNSDKTPNESFWKKHYPENPQDAIRERLKEYLALASSVDFQAATSGEGKRQTFDKPEYENKSLQWKAIYRAGKDVNQEVTAFANAWLKELSAK
jgi:hypothetical protein